MNTPPLSPVRQAVLAQSGAASRALMRYWAERDAEEAAGKAECERITVTSDPVLGAIELMAPYVDEVDRGVGKCKPSHLMKIAYCMIASNNPKAARRQFAAWQLEARRRWRSGFCATPFGVPVLRQGVRQ